LNSSAANLPALSIVGDGHVNKVALRWARLVLGLVIVSGLNSQCRKIYLYI